MKINEMKYVIWAYPIKKMAVFGYNLPYTPSGNKRPAV